jgi:hypothetical protein
MIDRFVWLYHKYFKRIHVKKTFEILNQMQDEKVFSLFALGGGMACLFYMEPFVTFDLDVFILLESDRKSGIISLESIYTWLYDKGYTAQQEQVIIEGVPVQFLIAYNQLVEESVEKAEIKKYDDISVRVCSAEYLAAIMLQTGRPKDISRLSEFVQQSGLNMEKLGAILKKHDMWDKMKIIESML